MISRDPRRMQGGDWAGVATEGAVAVSLDHDLGDEAVVWSGYQLACHIEQGAHAGTLPRLVWAIQSANHVGHKRMEVVMQSAERAWYVRD